ncbi:MAG: hypothetical protein H6728_09255 [Myxococcales bacterium]|nr:hypothetical protein [Myxococcales bacterium]MCB9643251.1 hypothetical protein [Myxococcales bacterium]
MHFSFQRLVSRALWLGLLVISLGTVACDDEDRFRLPEHQQNRQPKEQIVAAQLKVKVPTDLPVWTEMSQPIPGRLFQPEPVKLQGKAWLREGSSKAFEFYFQRENSMLAHSFAVIADSITAFLRQWMDSPFERRIQVVLMPESAPSDKVFPWNEPRIAVPQTLEPKVVIYTGSDQVPYLSKYGRVSALMDAAARVLITRQAQKDPRDFWRNIVFPAYFAFRGICAMLDAEYNKTAMPKFRKILEEVGRPTPEELKQNWSYFQQNKVPSIAQERTIRSAMAVLGYIEDHFSRGALAVIVRRLKKDPKLTLWKATQDVIGQDQKTVWKEMKRFYFPHAWKRAL